jgi:hypothetical protein
LAASSTARTAFLIREEDGAVSVSLPILLLVGVCVGEVKGGEQQPNQSVGIRVRAIDQAMTHTPHATHTQHKHAHAPVLRCLAARCLCAGT